MKVRAHGRGSGAGNLVHPTPAGFPPRRRARLGRRLRHGPQAGSARVSRTDERPPAARPFGFPRRRCPPGRWKPRAGISGSRTHRSRARARGPRPSTTCGRDSTPTITAIGLTRATFAKRSPTWRGVMTAPTQTTGAGSGARRRLHLPSRKYPAALRHGHPIAGPPLARRLRAAAAAVHLHPHPLPRTPALGLEVGPHQRTAGCHRRFHAGQRQLAPAVTEAVFPARHWQSVPGPGRSTFEAAVAPAGRRRPPRAPCPTPPKHGGQKYSEEEFGARGCQQRRAWLPLPKSGLHGFRERRYR
jgi:hypothetical protein